MRFLLAFLKSLFRYYPTPISCKSIDILVNGPSLKQDLETYDRKGKRILVVNQFVRHESFQKLKPDYYLIQDPYFWDETIQGHWSEKRNITIQLLNERVNWEINLILPDKAKNYFETKINNKKIKITYFKEVPLPSYLKKKKTYNYLLRILLDFNIISAANSNVLLTAIYLAIYSKTKEINIFGADMSFFKTLIVNQRNNYVGIEEQHFYGNEFFEISLSKHAMVKSTLSDQLSKWANIFKEFERLSHYASDKGVKLSNKSSYSLIDSINR